MPIYEPGLEEMIRQQVAAGRLSFETDTGKATRQASTIFLAVGTPPAKGGGFDFSYLFAAADIVAKSADGPKTLVVKSTVSPGYGQPDRRTGGQALRTEDRGGEQSGIPA